MILPIILIWIYVGLLFYILMTIELDGRITKEDIKFRYIFYASLFGFVMILFYFEAKNNN